MEYSIAKTHAINFRMASASYVMDTIDAHESNSVKDVHSGYWMGIRLNGWPQKVTTR